MLFLPHVFFITQCEQRKGFFELHTFWNAFLERPAHLQCSHVPQVPSQSIESWPSEVAEESLMNSSQTGHVKDLLEGFFLVDLLASVGLTCNTCLPPFLEFIWSTGKNSTRHLLQKYWHKQQTPYSLSSRFRMTESVNIPIVAHPNSNSARQKNTNNPNVQ